MASNIMATVGSGKLMQWAEFLGTYTPELNKLGESALKFNKAVFSFTQKIATEMQASWRASKQAGLSMQQYQSLQYASKSTGNNIDDTLESLKAFGQYLEDINNRDFLQDVLKINIRDDSGNSRSRDELFSELLLLLETMPEEMVKLLGEQTGMTPATQLSIIQGIGNHQKKYAGMAAQIGYDPEQAEEQTRPFLKAWNELGSVTSMLGQKYGAQLAVEMAGPLERLTQTILQNLPAIEAACTAVINGIAQAVDLAVEYLPGLIQGIDAVVNKIGGWETVLTAILVFMAGKWIVGIIGSLVRATSAFRDFYKASKGLLSKNKLPTLPAPKAKPGTGFIRDIRDKLGNVSKKGIWSRGLSKVTSLAKSVGPVVTGALKRYGPTALRASLTVARVIPSPVAAAINIGSFAAWAGVYAYKKWGPGKDKQTAPADENTNDRYSYPRPEQQLFANSQLALRKEAMQSQAESRPQGHYLSPLNAQLLSNNPYLPVNSPALQNALDPNWLSTTLGDIRTGINSIAAQLPQQIVNNIQQTNHCYVSGTGEPQMVADKVLDNYSRLTQILAPRGV